GGGGGGEKGRGTWIPGFDEVKQKAMQAGAMGGGITGSGPSVFMFCKDLETAQKVSLEMQSVFDNILLECKSYVTRPAQKGIEILELK
ncbi:MAG: homoserine kinase, partial [Ferruginibacter sp.]